MELLQKVPDKIVGLPVLLDVWGAINGRVPFYTKLLSNVTARIRCPRLPSLISSRRLPPESRFAT